MTSARRGQRNHRIEHPCLLLVEGNDEYHFFRRMIERRQKDGVQIIQYSEQAKLGSLLAGVIVPDPQFAALVRVVGVVKDADLCYERAFQSVQDSLRHANLPIPAAPLSYGDAVGGETAIKSIAYIMPDNGSQGDLETLCLAAVNDSPAITCVSRYFECLASINHVPRQVSKAKLGAFLSANLDKPNLRMGEAIAAGVLPWNSPAFQGVHQFLDMIDAAM